MRLAASLSLLALSAPALAQSSFVNWESPHVHPLDRAGSRLLAVNTPDARLEVFDVSGASPAHLFDVPVGLDPVSVRARTADEVWVVNHVSDSVSVVDLATRNVVATLDTDDEPTDVVFAGTPERAFVSCSQANTVLVFDPSNLAAAPVRVTIEGEEPKAMAVSSAGDEVYVALFESGNRTTVLAGGATGGTTGFPPQVVNDPAGPWGGQNPPPNSGANFSPPQNPSNPAPPAVSLIVRKNASGQWMDDNGGDWTAFVSGPQAGLSGRPVGWDLADHDVAIIDASTLSVAYATGLMNINMAIAVQPGTGHVTVVGTDATNEIRYEPNLNGTFVRANLARVDATSATAVGISDLNPHLTYAAPTVAQSERDKSLGDPRGIVWVADGSKGYVTGMGSNNVIVIDAAGARAGLSDTIVVGEGPTGIALDEGAGRAYVLDKFESAISTIDLTTELETSRVSFYDPSPSAIKNGRRHFYDTHETSGLGQVACASCHVDVRMDRLGWDLGDPSGNMKSPAGQNTGGIGGNFPDWHPMKGPMTTQTLQDIIGKEPHHWRGDRNGLEEFNGAFQSLLGDDEQLTPAEMQEFEDFLATIHFPPNPYRKFDNTLPGNLPLPGHVSSGRFSPKGTPLPNGNANAGLQIYRPPTTLDAVACVTCHTLPVGIGSDFFLSGFSFQPFPVGPNGEHHSALVNVDGFTNVTMKVPQLRNQYEKVGFDTSLTINHAGFGFVHDGSVDTIAQFVSEPVFAVGNDQQVANLVAFLLCFSGSDLPQGSTIALLEPPGVPGNDTHAAVGTQTTLVDAGTAPAPQLSLIADMEALANTGKVGLVVKGVQAGLPRGYAYLGAGTYQSDRAAEQMTVATLLAAAAPGSELTYTVVAKDMTTRVGIDRDEDGCFDRDEIDAGSDPTDAGSCPGAQPGTPYCFGAGCPCGNDDPNAGCVNSTGAGALLTGSGSTSVAADDLVLTATNCPPNNSGLFFGGDTQLSPAVFVGDGLGCAGGFNFRYFPGAVGPDGTFVKSGLVATAPAGFIAAGVTRNFQAWTRDVLCGPPPSPCPSPCGLNNNLSNAYSVTFVP